MKMSNVVLYNLLSMIFIGSVAPHDRIHASTFRISESFPLHYNRVYWTNSILGHAYHTVFGQTKSQSTRVIFVKGLHQIKALKNEHESRFFGNSFAAYERK